MHMHAALLEQNTLRAALVPNKQRAAQRAMAGSAAPLGLPLSGPAG